MAGIFKKLSVMKTLMKKLMIETLLTGIIFLLSCMSEGTGLNPAENNAIAESAAVMLNKSINENHSIVSGNMKNTDFSKTSLHLNQIINALPISFGSADLILISN